MNLPTSWSLLTVRKPRSPIDAVNDIVEPVRVLMRM
jgi:hypothetical protein